VSINYEAARKVLNDDLYQVYDEPYAIDEIAVRRIVSAALGDTVLYERQIPDARIDPIIKQQMFDRSTVVVNEKGFVQVWPEVDNG